MDDLIEDAGGAPGNAPEFTVSEISGAGEARANRGPGFRMSAVRGPPKKGSGDDTMPRSGHVYLDLKGRPVGPFRRDLEGHRRPASPIRPRRGWGVIRDGAADHLPGQSKYQLVIEDLARRRRRADGDAGKARAMLCGRGLFDEARKQPLAVPCPRSSGVVNLTLGRGDPRHPAPPARPVSAPRP